MEILKLGGKPHSQNMDEIMESVCDLSDLEVYELLSYVAKRASYVSMDRVTVTVETSDGQAIDNVTYELGLSVKVK